VKGNYYVTLMMMVMTMTHPQKVLSL